MVLYAVLCLPVRPKLWRAGELPFVRVAVRYQIPLNKNEEHPSRPIGGSGNICHAKWAGTGRVKNHRLENKTARAEGRGLMI